MSDAKALRCDRCGKRELCTDDKDGGYPSGWSNVRIQVPRPYCDTGYRDLCDECTPIVYNVVHNKSTAMTVPNPIEAVLQILVDATARPAATDPRVSEPLLCCARYSWGDRTHEPTCLRGALEEAMTGWHNRIPWGDITATPELDGDRRALTRIAKQFGIGIYSKDIK